MTDDFNFSRQRFVLNPSMASVEDLNFGRMAFLGMNPDIEKMMSDERVRLEEAEELKKEKDVQDDEMADRYARLSQTVAKKFASKREKASTASAASGGGKVPVLSDEDAQKLFEKGGSLLDKVKNRSMMKDSRVHKPRKGQFMKPKE